MIQTAAFEHRKDNRAILHRIQDQFTHFEDEYLKLKEITTLLELTLWKSRMHENISLEEAIQCRKQIKTDEYCSEDSAALPVELMLSYGMYCHI